MPLIILVGCKESNMLEIIRYHTLCGHHVQRLLSGRPIARRPSIDVPWARQTISAGVASVTASDVLTALKGPDGALLSKILLAV